MNQKPLVSVVIPTRNESQRIRECLESILDQDWPLGSLEVIIADGSSEDGTAETALTILGGRGLARFEVFDNPVASTPSNLNRALEVAEGVYIARVDARSRIPRDYVRTCVRLLEDRPEVVVVGGRQVAVSPTVDATGQGIARALNNRYAMGLSKYRRGATSGPSDTVYLGFFRTDDLRSTGGWDERFSTNQDYELNRRIGRDGVVWFESSLGVGYVPRNSFPALFDQYRRFGSAKVSYWRMTGDRPRPRQLVILGTPLLGITMVGVLACLLPRRFLAGFLGVVALDAIAGMFALDAVGSEGAASIAVRANSVAAMSCVSGGWLLGVWLLRTEGT